MISKTTAGVLLMLVAGCSAVPDVVFVDEDAAAAPTDAAASDGAAAVNDAAAGSSSGGPPPSCAQVVPGVPLVCCGRMQCVGDECGRCATECPSKCNDPAKKYCCQTDGKFECLDHDDRCGT